MNRDAAFVAVLVLLVTVCVAPRFRGPIDLRWDAGVYWLLGTSLAEGKGYRLLNEPGQIQETQYPPLFPASIAAVEVLTASHDPAHVGRWLRVGFLFLFGAYVLGTYWMSRRFVPPAAAFAVGVFCAVNSYSNFIGDQATADLPYAFATVVFVLFATGRPARLKEVLTGATCVAAYLVRTAALALMFAWIAEALLKRRFGRGVVRVGVCLVPVIAWNGYVHTVEKGPEYARPAYSYQRADYLFYNVSYSRNAALKDPFQPEEGKISVRNFFTQRLFPNIVSVPSKLGQAVTSQNVFWESNAFSAGRRFGISRDVSSRIGSTVPVMIGILVLCGAVVFLLRGHMLVFLTMLFSVGLMCVTPWPEQMVRYAIPLNPLSALFLVTALLTLAEVAGRAIPANRRWPITAALVLIVVFLASQSAWTLVRFYRDFHSRALKLDACEDGKPYSLFFYDPSYRALDQALDWIKERANRGDILASAMPAWGYIRTGLRSVMVPLERNPAAVQRELDSVPAAFLILQQHGPFDMEPYVRAVADNTALWSKAYSDKKGYIEVYRRVR